jgi:cytochrome c-type biogenesis protein CcmE
MNKRQRRCIAVLFVLAVAGMWIAVFVVALSNNMGG